MVRVRISYVNSRVTIETVRPLHQFLGVSGPSFCLSPEAFNPPIKRIDKSTPEKFKSRLSLNLAYFLSNYALVVAGVTCVVCLLHPGMLIALGFLWALWGAHHFLISNEVVVAGTNVGTLVSINHRATILSIATVVVIVWKCLFPAITVVVVSGLIILGHATLRDPKHIDVSSGNTRGGYRSSDDEDDHDSGENSDESEVIVEKPAIV